MADVKNTKYSDSDNEVLSTYLKTIDKIPLLTYDEEYELALKAKVTRRPERNLLTQISDLSYLLQRNSEVRECLLKT